MHLSAGQLCLLLLLCFLFFGGFYLGFFGWDDCIKRHKWVRSLSSLSLSVPGCGCEKAERQSSSVVSGGCSGSAGRSCGARPHQPAECKMPVDHPLLTRCSLDCLTDRHLLQEKKNGIELFVSSDRLGISEPRPAEEVIQSLNVRVLHRHLGHFGITEVSTEVCVCVSC